MLIVMNTLTGFGCNLTTTKLKFTCRLKWHVRENIIAKNIDYGTIIPL